MENDWTRKIDRLRAALKEKEKQIADLTEKLRLSELRGDSLDRVVGEQVQIRIAKDKQIAVLEAENKRMREALRDIVIWAEGSTCEICGKKKMIETDAYDYARKALKEVDNDKA